MFRSLLDVFEFASVCLLLSRFLEALRVDSLEVVVIVFLDPLVVPFLFHQALLLGGVAVLPFQRFLLFLALVVTVEPALFVIGVGIEQAGVFPERVELASAGLLPAVAPVFESLGVGGREIFNIRCLICR